MKDTQVKSKQRVADHGEVFTPAWMVEAMLDLVKDKTETIDATFLEPACGSGNFLVKVLERKLTTVEAKYGSSEYGKTYHALLALMSLYGIELLLDNVMECRANMLEILADYLRLEESDVIYQAAQYVLHENIIHGDARKMQTQKGQPITFAEWGPLGNGKYQRRDFSLKNLAQSAAYSEDPLFAKTGKEDLFAPCKTYPPMRAQDLAQLAAGIGKVTV